MFSRFTTLVMLCSSFSVYANVTLHVPEEIDLLSVNMHSPALEGKLFSSNKTQTLPNGENQIVFQYEPVFENRDSRKKAYSKTIIAKFSAENSDVHFVVPKYKSLNQAERQIQTLDWQLANGEGNVISLLEDELKNNGVQINRNINQEAEQYNKQGGIAAVEVSYVIATSQLSQAATLTEKAIEQPVAMATIATDTQGADSKSLSQLKAWYQKTSHEDQKLFKKWLVDQE
ncbi:hypothetical protein BCU68_11075 [Vibrio sp. 10N.286.49.B3]|uniref:DUF2057 family protein n=1 Tax=Vibrio sp. 10N.286.49.B3 TaxID=1880855 RepID=UPI000C823DB3|nr:DUF2057 family protein [Vibrio sp. 10N.286.49.B3]PMH44978.1 hypothetical protein BCU68_11075 [Vibrio sp. 10N.286.49.B3]